MPEETYLDLIDQLAEIKFSGELTYSRYNEPLSHRDLIIKRIKQARERLPNVTLRINTNGDYVTRDYIEELCDIGFNELWIQQYLSNDERYNHEKMRQRAQKKIKKLELPATILTDIDGDTIEIATDYTRTQKCTQVSNNMYIDYNGSVMVCCALRSDVPGQESGIMGHISDGRLWDIYMSDKYKPWREHHKEDGPKEGFCKTCRDSVEPSYMKEKR